MIGEPWFWRERTLAAQIASGALVPIALLYDGAQRLRAITARPARVDAPVFCVGNATLGGVGKTPFAMLLAARLAAFGARPHFLTRGYGGAEHGPLRVDPARHDAAAVGDEALLLAAASPTWVARARPAGARAAVAAGAGAIVMDDGHQNPSLEKTASFLLINACDPDGNGAVFPAGPLREPMARAEARADMVVEVFDDAGSASAARKDEARLHAWLEPLPLAETPERVLAFCGIGAPERFFGMLRRNGFDVAGRRAYPDHSPYDAATIKALRAEARALKARLITTRKDFVRLGAEARADIRVFDVAMHVDDPSSLDTLLLAALKQGEKAAP